MRNVTLTVKDTQGLSSSITRHSTRRHRGRAPRGEVHLVVQQPHVHHGRIDLHRRKSIASYDWSLGKSRTARRRARCVTTNYPHTDTRKVTLTVTDTKGQTNSVTQAVTP